MQYNQNMEDILKRKEKFIGFPFYIFITILLGIFGIITTQTAWQDDTPGIAILGAVLITIHIGLYWLNLRLFNKPRWWMFYYIAQTLLILALALMPFGANILGTVIIAIITEALGVWGNTRRTFTAGVLYTGLMIILFAILLDRAELFKHLTQIMINGGFIILLMIVFNQQLEQREKAEELAETLESANAKLAAYAARNEALTLQAERERMARELHDTLAQGVAGLVLQLEAIKAYQNQSEHSQAEKILSQALDRARNTLSESRAAIEDLRNEERDFQQTVEKLVEQFGAAGKTGYELTVQLDAKKPIPQHIRHHARRVLHEALTNIQKHAQAEAAHVSVDQNGNALKLTIQDNGVGFDPQQVPTRGHFGLQGFQERAQLTNSRYTLVSAPDEGTTVEFIFPLDETGDRA